MSSVQIRLRPVTEADLPDYVRWLNDPEVVQFTSIEAGTLTLEGERKWLAGITLANPRWAVEAQGHHIGNCGLSPDESRQQAVFGIIIGDKTAWNKGYGSAALREVLRIGFEDMGLHRIHLTAFAENARAIRCYENCGFRHEGLQRQAVLKGDAWHDHVLMAILRYEWEAMHHPGPDDGRVRIRDFVLNDYPQVAELWQAAGLSPRPSDTRDEVAKKLRRDPDLFLVACDGPRIVGSVLGGWDGRRCWVYRVAVHPDYQRKGIGRTLMSELEKRLGPKGALAINIIRNARNDRARAFYRSLGYEDRETVSVMAKALASGEEQSDGY